ncbi:unnamed protein product [Staurois parvus]|uniref:Uncharacterized protein n=1 Tax=Staurois parvus TaxID=386267 RepID=A0ABN9FC94_9NEOB|nr:unnamed protein product [Staurois parvus]
MSAHQCHLPGTSTLIISVDPAVPHISAHLNCLSVLLTSASQCRLSVPYMSAAFQFPSVMPVNAHQCHLPV